MITEAIANVLALDVLILIIIGVIWGLIFGMIPGLTATLAVIVLIPITYSMDTLAAISMLTGVFIGGISGGVVAAVLIGMPGTPSSITTVFDGHPMAKKGLGSEALGVGITSNLIGSLFGWLFLITLTPQIADLALKIDSFGYAAIIIFGLVTVVSLSGESLLKGLLMAIFGLAITTIGIDPINGVSRGTMGIDVLKNGLSFLPVMIGLLVISQVFEETKTLSEKFVIPKSSSSRVFMRLNELKQSIKNFIRSSLIGLGLGILPGIGGAIANFVSYNQAKNSDSNPETFGKGNIQGIVASETANNATIAGAFIPMLALGIPGDAVTAALLGGLELHGLKTGPLLMEENPLIVYSIFIAFVIAVIVMFLSMILGARLFPIILRIPKSYLLPLVMVASLVGVYNI